MIHVPTREKDCHRIAAHVMNPAFLSKLSHAGVDPWNSCAAGFPFLEPDSVPFPGDLECEAILFDLIEIVVFERELIEVLAPVELLCGIS